MKLYDLVYNLLQENPELRDSDKKLIWKVWEVQGISTSGMITHDDFINVAISTESIRRCRQKVQEHTPGLRGSKEIQEVREELAKDKGTHVFEVTVSQDELFDNLIGKM